MKILIDMNLSPEWVGVLEAAGWQAMHWSSIGKASAPDEEIFEHAKNMNLLFSRTIWILDRYSPQQMPPIPVSFKFAFKM